MDSDPSENIKNVLQSSENIIANREFIKVIASHFKKETDYFNNIHDTVDKELLDSLSSIVNETAKTGGSVCDCIKESFTSNTNNLLPYQFENNSRAVSGAVFFSLSALLIYNFRRENRKANSIDIQKTDSSKDIQKTTSSENIQRDANIDIVSDYNGIPPKRSGFWNWFAF